MNHHYFRILAILFAFVSAVPAQAQRYADQFSVEGIEVDVVGPTAEDAKVGAFREAAKRGWKRLWDRLADPGRKGGAGGLSDSDVRNVVTSIEISRERMSGKRYIATFRIFYDPSAVRRALSRAGAGFGGGTSKTMLLLPLLVDGGASSVYEPGNIWSTAWAKYPLLRSRVEYVRADGSLADAVLLNATEARLRDPDRLRQLTLRYRSDGVLVARAYVSRTYPTGPVSVNFSGYTMFREAPISVFSLASNTDRDLPMLFEEAIRRLDVAFALSKDKIDRPQFGAPKFGVVKSFGGLVGFVSTPDKAALDKWTSRIGAAQSIGGVTIQSLSIGGSTELRISSTESREYVRWALQQSGLYMEPDGFVREALPGDVALPRPQSRAELEAERKAAEAALANQPLGSIDSVLDQVERDTKPKPKPAEPSPDKPQSILPRPQ
jgi:Uncharacterized protein conserved in bacteria (DUF2066)